MSKPNRKMNDETRKKQRELFDRFRNNQITEAEFHEQYQHSADDDPGMTPLEEMRELGHVDDDQGDS